jgi:hypothetical protein
MRKIKIWFTDFWDGFNYHHDPIFGELLFNNFELVLDSSPDILIFSVFGTNHFNFTNCVKILYTPENFYEHKYVGLLNNLGHDDIYNICDFSITSFKFNEDKNFRMPCYIRRYGYKSVGTVLDRSIKLKTKTCLYLQNNCTEIRDDFVRKLSTKIKIDSPGKCLNNTSLYVEDKLKFIADYKFVISFENSSTPYYSSEKLYDCFLSKTLPIYWGDPQVHNDFNPNSMITLNNLNDFDSVLDYILYLDNNENEYYNMLSNNPILNQDLISSEKFLTFFKKILNGIY